jgi:hypothetical protein
LVDITPHVSLLSKVGQSGHSVAEAVAELVDNALDAKLARRKLVVEVSYNVREGWIRIADDGLGMSRAQLADALVLGLSYKGEQHIGKFGLGMKTACTALGDRFEIWTATPEASYAHIADYDEEQFLVTGEWKLPIRRRKKERPHGTVVSIQSSRLYPTLHQSLLRNLGWTFRHFILDGLLDLRINGVPVEPARYEVDESSVMPFEGTVADQKVRGWVGLLHKSSQRGWYGFGLVRHRRIIRRHEKLGFQPHPQTARVVGELHLDEFATNNLKTDFIRETPAWRELEEWVSATIEPVIAQSRALAHAGMLDLKIKARIEEERHRVLGDLGESSLNLPGAPGLSSDATVSRPVAVAVGAAHFEHVFVEGADDAPYAEVVVQARNGETDLIAVRTNLAHAAASQISDRSGWACHNIAEAAAQHLGSREDFVTLKSVVLGKLLGERPLRRALTESARELLRTQEPELALGAESI